MSHCPLDWDDDDCLHPYRCQYWSYCLRDVDSMLASLPVSGETTSEQTLDAIESMLLKKKRMGTLFDVQQIRAVSQHKESEAP